MRRPILAATCGLAISSAALPFAQGSQDVGELASRLLPIEITTGPLVVPPGDGGGLCVVYAREIEAAGAPWTRLLFDELTLPGDGATEHQAYLKITSLTDGATQYLNARTAAEWQNSSAFFNGSTVRIELWSMPGLGPASLRISRLLAGTTSDLESPADLCGPDDRQPVADNRSARLVGGSVSFPTFCSSFVIDDTNHCFLTAGHCNPSGTNVVQFNIPPTNDLRQVQHPPPEDQYAVDGLSSQRSTVGVGNDWGYFGVFANANTGLLPFQVYGLNHSFALTPPAVNGQTIRITGNGSTEFPIPNNRHYTLQTSTGPFTQSSFTLRYNVDTTGGNSGSVVIDESTGQAIGIHYLAGCTSGGNQAVPCNNANLRAALNNPAGVARSGVGSVLGPLFAIGDANNNFGTVNGPPARFAKIAQIGSAWQGLAYDSRRERFLACDSARRLFAITQAGTPTLLGIIAGDASGSTIINGLGYDARTDTLFGIAQATGQLYAISPGTTESGPVATVRGGPLGGSIGALEFDDQRNALFGLDDTATATRLVRINPDTGVRTLVGSLGDDLRDANGLAWRSDTGLLYTIGVVNDFLYSINPATGVATRVGFTFGSFGAAYGMAAVNPRPCLLDVNDDGLVTPDDLGDFITGYFDTPQPAFADFTLDGMVSPDDLDAYITAYFAGGC
ncbi:MAG: DUF6923 family protein [Phycisphaerales bacterium]